MRPETEGKIKYGVWGLVCGAIVVMIIGFAWGGWVTASGTKTIAEKAVLASQTEICVAQFMADPNHKEKLDELGKLNIWKRPEFIEKGGWDKMPGQEKSDYAVSRACADGLGLMIKK